MVVTASSFTFASALAGRIASVAFPWFILVPVPAPDFLDWVAPGPTLPSLDAPGAGWDYAEAIAVACTYKFADRMSAFMGKATASAPSGYFRLWTDSTLGSLVLAVSFSRDARPICGLSDGREIA
jgi:hypothetical protein